MSIQLTGLEGKVAVVTGAGRMRSIGRSIAIELARGEDRKPVTEVDPAVWRKVIDVNLNGSFYMSHVFGQKGPPGSLWTPRRNCHDDCISLQ